MSENKNMLVEILKAGADIYAQGSDSRSPLHHAAQGNPSLLECILAFKGEDIDLNIKDRNGQSPLHYVYTHCKRRIRKQDEDKIDLLIKYGADPNLKDNSGKVPGDYRP